MDKQPSFDRALIIPILIGGLSVVGIIVVLLVARSLNAPAEIAVTPSATPFQYIYLGTEPAITTPFVEGSELPPTAEELDATPVRRTPTGRPAATPIILATATNGGQLTNTPAPTSTSASGPPLNPGTYEDLDSHLIYAGAWNQTGTGDTLHVSSVPGSTISFRFIGRELRIFYDGGSTLGRMTVTIDNQSATLDQSAGNEWVSATFPNGTHTVLITHASGGAVNLDYVIIPEPTLTATPTRTRTATPTP